MIITRSPLRISLGGGGTDLPSYYSEYGGFLISAAIDKYIYITLHEAFKNEIILKYSDYEKVKEIGNIKHPIIREVLQLLEVKETNIEMCSMADIPSGTGLGSSSSFTTALLKAVHAWNGDSIGRRALAEEACKVEINLLGQPIGKQDQYIASFGGITCMEFQRNGDVLVEPLNITRDTRYNLEDNLMLYFTGFSRTAGSILTEQDTKSKENNEEMLHNLHIVKELGYQSKKAFEKGDLETFADIMNVHWEHKKRRHADMSNAQINEWYDYAMNNGALGGKMIGAGGGGFLLFYVKDKIKLREALSKTKMMEVRFRFEKEGTKIL